MKTKSYKISIDLQLSRKKGFTLIELMIVCAIVAILSVVVVLGYSKAKAKSRDAKRVTDMETIAGAFRMYYEESGTFKLKNPTAPSECPGAKAGVACGQGSFNFPLDQGGYSSYSINKALVDKGYLTSIFDDPACKYLDEPPVVTGQGTTQFCYAVYFIDKEKISVFTKTETFSTAEKDQSIFYSVAGSCGDSPSTACTTYNTGPSGPGYIISTAHIPNGWWNYATSIVP